jgi:hypothetical protein
MSSGSRNCNREETPAKNMIIAAEIAMEEVSPAKVLLWQQKSQSRRNAGQNMSSGSRNCNRAVSPVKV